MGLSLVVLVAWVVAFVQTLLNLRLIRSLRDAASVEGPRLSVIVPARNEERSIARTVRALLAQTYRDLEIIVVDDRSSDSTGRLLQEIAFGDPRLIVISGEEPPAGWLGKPWALHQGSLRASGELLLFVDADIHYQPAAVAAAVAELQHCRAEMLALFPHVEMRGFWENVAMPQLSVVVFTFLPAFLSNRMMNPRMAIGGGSGNLVRRDAYDKAGGHEALRSAVVDDVGLARLFRSRGFRTQTVLAGDFVSVRMYEGGREIVEGFTKNMFAALGRSYFVTITLAILGVLFHVWPYVAAILGDPLAVGTVVLITLSRLLVFARLRYSLVAALFAHPLMVLVFTWISLRSMWLTGVKRQLTWRGRVYDASHTRFGADR